MSWFAMSVLVMSLQTVSTDPGETTIQSIVSVDDEGARAFEVVDLSPSSQVYWIIHEGQRFVRALGPFAHDNTTIVVPDHFARNLEGYQVRALVAPLSGNLGSTWVGPQHSLGNRSAPRPMVLTVDGTSPGTHNVIRVDGNGRSMGQVPFLQAIVPGDLVLGSVGEERRFRRNVPKTIHLKEHPGDPGRTAIQLPDQSTIILYRKPATNLEGLARVYRDGLVELIWEEPIVEIGEPAIDPTVAVSDFGPYLAFLIRDGLSVKQYRTDGVNWPNGTSLIRDVTPIGATDLAAQSMAFGRDVMILVDETLGPFRIPTQSGTPIAISLPLSGAVIPTVFDEEFALSGDGRSFAFGAGSDDKIKDVYVVRDDGSAVNVTQSVADYEEVGYSDPDRILKMALSFDGDLVSYIDTDSFPEPECFVTEVVFPTPELITSSQAFVDSIDIGSVVRFTPDGSALVAAGLNIEGLDLFVSPTAQDSDIANITLSSPVRTAPFGKFGKLRTPDIGSIDGEDQFLVTTMWSSGLPQDSRSGRLGGDQGAKGRMGPHTELILVDPALGKARVIASDYAGQAISIPHSTNQSTSILAIDGNTIVLADPSDSSIGFKREYRLDTAVSDFSLASSTEVVLMSDTAPGSRSLCALDLVLGTSWPLSDALGDLRDLRADFGGNQIWFITEESLGRELARFIPGRGVVTTSIDHVRLFLQGP